MTKSDLRTRVLQAADAVGTTRWDTTANGEVDQHIGIVMDKEWKRILNANAFYRVSRLAPVSDSDGYYALADFSSGTGDSTQRLYRIIAITIDNVVYEQTQLSRYVLAPTTTVATPMYLWYIEGTKIAALPKQTLKEASVVVNWIPPRQDQLSGDSVTVDFPNGYENVLVWASAAQLLNKGGAESDAASILAAQAEELREDMLQDLARQSIKPITMQFNDMNYDWASI